MREKDFLFIKENCENVFFMKCTQISDEKNPKIMM